MSITTSRTTILSGAPPVMVYSAVGNAAITIFSDGGGVCIGGSSEVTPETGFHLTERTLPLALKNGDKIWAVATQKTNLSIIATS